MSKELPHFGPYQTERRLGAGGMAETFVAVRRGPGGFEQRVCIKRVLPAYASDRDFVDAFLREARTSAALRHANIAQVLDFGLADDSYYLALELIDGLDLRALLLANEGNRRTPLEHEIVTVIAGDLAAALEHAHAGGPAPVVHRDVSPSNVLLSRAGEVKLTDFGIARALGGAHVTATGVIKGKVPYLPPEYIEHGKFDQRSDLFSLGVLLFELLTGTRPFDGESDLDTIRRIAAGERKPLLELAPDTPAALASCVERLIATAPEQRFASAQALLDALPSVAVHPARKRLGGLVRARLGESSAPVPPAPEDPHGLAKTLPASSPPPFVAPPIPAATRTLPHAQGGPSGLSRGALAALIGAGLAFVALLAAIAIKAVHPEATAQVHPPPPPPPPPPGSPESPPTPDEPLPESDATSAPAPMQPVLEPVERPSKSAELHVVVTPFGEIWIDGKPQGHGPVLVRLPAGSHEVGVGDGRPEQMRAIQLRAGQREDLIIRRDVAAQ